MAKLTKFERSQNAHSKLYKSNMKKGNVNKAVYHEMCRREQARSGSLLSKRGKKEIYEFCMR